MGELYQRDGHRRTHILLPDKDRSEKIFALSFVKLMRFDGTTLRDGEHDLIVYKAEAKKLEDSSLYLSLPATKLELEEKGHFPTGKSSQSLGNCTISKDSFQIATLVCSTKLTQNEFPIYTQARLPNVFHSTFPTSALISTTLMICGCGGLLGYTTPESKARSTQRFNEEQACAFHP
ncbi:dedicator of cytokinesis protein 1 isoform X1, partial [Tachysurus ichikawai]